MILAALAEAEALQVVKLFPKFASRTIYILQNSLR